MSFECLHFRISTRIFLEYVFHISMTIALIYYSCVLYVLENECESMYVFDLQ